MGLSTAAIVVAAGKGERFGGYKQLMPLGSRRVLDASLSVASSAVDVVICVKPPGMDCGELEADVIVDGGATRSESVRAGLRELPSKVTIVLVHDAARPLASADLYHRIIDRLLNGAEAVIPVVSMTDTVKEVIGNKVASTLDRSRLFRVQTPQGFQRKVLELAHESQFEATDDSQLVEQIGISVEAIIGEESNFKITTARDLEFIRELAGGGDGI